MKLLHHDLHDLYALFIFLRAHPHRFPAYREGIQRIHAHIAAPEQGMLSTDSIRRCLRPCHVPEDDWLSWVQDDEACMADVRTVDNGAYYPLLAAMLQELLAQGDNPDRLHLLCDALHNIPSILMSEAQPRKRIHEEIEPYRAQYNPDFLHRELCTIR